MQTPPDTVEVDAWTYDHLLRIALVRELPVALVLEEMLEDWTPTADQISRARRRPRGMLEI